MCGSNRSQPQWRQCNQDSVLIDLAIQKTPPSSSAKLLPISMPSHASGLPSTIIVPPPQSNHTQLTSASLVNYHYVHIRHRCQTSRLRNYSNSPSPRCVHDELRTTGRRRCPNSSCLMTTRRMKRTQLGLPQ